MDERRHNMDGALFVDEEERSPQRERREHSARPRGSQDDGKAEAACRVTQGILDRMELEARVHVREDDEQVVLDIDGPDAGRAIGKKGMTLEALQFLVNKIVNREPEERRHIVLDSGDYRERHDNGLVSMAKREAKRAISSGRAVTLEPMSARDRRVIHVSLAKFPGVSTRSEGEGTERRLQIIPVRGERARDERDERARDDRSDRSRDDRSERGRDERTDRPREERVQRAPVEARAGARERSDVEARAGARERNDDERRERARPRENSVRGERPRAPGRDERARTDARSERAPEGEPRRDRALPERGDVEARASARDRNDVHERPARERNDLDERPAARERNDVEARAHARDRNDVHERAYDRDGHERAQRDLAPQGHERGAGDFEDEDERADRDRDLAGDERAYEHDPRGHDAPEAPRSREPELRSPARRDYDAGERLDRGRRR